MTDKPGVPGFTNKEVLVQIQTKLDLFIAKYDADIARMTANAEKDRQHRDQELSKRPTRGEIWSMMGAGGVIVAVVAKLVGQ